VSAAKRPVAALHAVILAGGAGERFWPASRRSHPKPFLKVIGHRTLLEATLVRARRFARPDRIWVVCGAEHADEVRRASGLPASRVLVEPRQRNTAMAVAWAAHRLVETDPEAVMSVLAADHHVPDVAGFARDIRLAARAAQREHVLVTFGVAPTRPETGYGYLQVGKPVRGFPRLREVRRFVEKPNRRAAQRYLRSGDYRWNAGIFVFRAATLLSEVERWAPGLHRALSPFRASKPGTARRRPARSRGGRANDRSVVETAYRRSPSLPLDVAVMERSDRVWTLPVSFDWSDVGTWSSLADALGVGQPGPGGPDGNRVIAGNVLLDEARDNLVWAGDRMVALLGVEDLVVVDTEDVILVTKRNAGPDVRRLVDQLRRRGRRKLL
jgi:mannose-1-phosphate guanylyltransferase/mannose-6-phosphate isomerase